MIRIKRSCSAESSCGVLVPVQSTLVCAGLLWLLRGRPYKSPYTAFDRSRA